MPAQKQQFEVTECQNGILISRKGISARKNTERAAFQFDFQETDAILMKMTRKTAEILDSSGI